MTKRPTLDDLLRENHQEKTGREEDWFQTGTPVRAGAFEGVVIARIESIAGNLVHAVEDPAGQIRIFKTGELTRTDIEPPPLYDGGACNDCD